MVQKSGITCKCSREMLGYAWGIAGHEGFLRTMNIALALRGIGVTEDSPMVQSMTYTITPEYCTPDATGRGTVG